MKYIMGATLLLGFSTAAMAADCTNRKIVVFGVDGMRPDAMERSAIPNMRALIAAGAYSNDANAEDLTFSGPNWSTILSGIHRDKHHVTTNDYSGATLEGFPDFLSRVEAWNSSLVTARMVTWGAIYLHQPTSADINAFEPYDLGGDWLIVDEAVQVIRGTYPGQTGDVDAMMVYLADVDVAGHRAGFDPSILQYRVAIATADQQIGTVLAAIRARPTYAQEQWLYLVVSDHGGSVDGTHAGNTREKRRVPFIVSGPCAARGQIYPGPKNVDIAPTVLAYMGVPIDPEWGLDGRPVGLTASGPPAFGYGANLIFNGDAEWDRGFVDATLDQYVAGWDDPGPSQTTVLRYDAGAGYPTAADPGPARRGNNFFCGGESDVGEMFQDISINAAAIQVDAGHLSYRLSGYLGGYADQNDRCELHIEFLAAQGSVLAHDAIGPVTNTDRGGRTGLLLRQTAGAVPPGSRTARVRLRSIKQSGTTCDGYADNLTLIFERNCIADFNADGGVDGADVESFFRCWESGDPLADVNEDGGVDGADAESFFAAWERGDC